MVIYIKFVSGISPVSGPNISGKAWIEGWTFFSNVSRSAIRDPRRGKWKDNSIARGAQVWNLAGFHQGFVLNAMSVREVFFFSFYFNLPVD